MRSVRLAVVVAVVLILSACGGSAPGSGSLASGPDGSTSAAGEWSFTTGFGQTVTLPAAPKVVVVDAYSAAALWDYGVRPTGVFGYGLEPNASPLALGDADRSSMTVVGTGGDLDLERLAAVRPDLVIGFGNLSNEGKGWTWWDEGVTAKATSIAPFLGVRSVGQKVPEVIEEYRRLAAALGADTTSDAIQRDQAAYQSAADALEATAERRQLRAIALNGDASSLYVGGPGLAQLGLLNDLGATTVGPPSKPAADGEDWAELSWELVPNYPADVVLAYVGSAKQFPEISIYRSLPAVKAQQVTVWDDKMPFTYRQYATWLTQVDTLYTDATKVAA